MSQPKIVTIKAGGALVVISEQESDDGRERRPNGFTPMKADEEQHFIIAPGRSLRIVADDKPADKPGE